jgi:hypothetical protein
MHDARHCQTRLISSGRTRQLPVSGYVRAVTALVTVPSRVQVNDQRVMPVRARFSAPHMNVYGPSVNLCYCSGNHSHVIGLPCSVVKSIAASKLSSFRYPA